MAAFAPAAFGQQVPALTPDIAIDGQIQPGEIRSYRLSATVDQFLHLSAAPAETDLTLRLSGPDGKVIAEANRLNEEGAGARRTFSGLLPPPATTQSV
ncbi:MAG: hypothetical protein ACRD8O_08680 [Bryobacteraceae bacterium]